MPTYRGYIIEEARPLCPEPFQFRHEDYDGPEDNRCGTATSLSDAIDQINELEEANCWQCGDPLDDDFNCPRCRIEHAGELQEAIQCSE